jgi:uncharacterized protein (TIGR03435 family)
VRIFSGLLATSLACATVLGQSTPGPAITLSFEVSSIKRNPDDTQGYVNIEPGARFNAVGATTMLIIRQAYGKLPFQLVNLPAWVTSEHYDIRAKAPDGIEVAPNMPDLLRSLLRDRFGFQAHIETRELPLYQLVLARADSQPGEQLRKATFDCSTRKPGTPPPSDAKGESLCGLTAGPNRLIFRGYPLERFASYLASSLERVVVDKTGLPGPWNFDLRFTPDQPVRLNGAVVPPDPNTPPLVTAIQEQLGLKLEPSRGPAEVLVIDRISRPTAD